jgi:hypothetical protein
MQNPWWVKNTTDIHYCIQMDPTGISATRDVIENITDRAMAYWKQEFSRELQIFGASSELNTIFAMSGVGRQQQIKMTCDGTEDLRIQFGYGTLTPEQRAYLPDPRRYVGVAVRTQYDSNAMRGKGFILIASDIGPDALAREDLIVKPWRFPAVLFQILLHEIGHVYGVPHIGPSYSFMNQEFPEAILDKKLEPYLPLLTLDDVTSFFLPSESETMCAETWTDAKSVRKFFNLPDTTNCLRFDLDHDKPLITISASTGFDEPFSTLGTLTIAGMTSVPIAVVPMRFPDGQTVFSQDDITSMTWIGGPFMMEFEISTLYYGVDGTLAKPLMVELGPSETSTIGEVDGVLVRFIAGMPNLRLSQLLVNRH